MFHVIKDERLVSKMEGKTNFLRRLKQFDGLTWLTLAPLFYDRSTPPTRSPFKSSRDFDLRASLVDRTRQAVTSGAVAVHKAAVLVAAARVVVFLVCDHTAPTAVRTPVRAQTITHV